MWVKQRIIRCVVAGFNANGEPDFWFIRVEATVLEIEEGIHYIAAENHAENNAFDAAVVYDEDNAAGKQLMPLVDWKNVSLVQTESISRR